MKGFQSIEEHPNHFVMHHSDGHQLHVAKAGLSKRTLQHIQKFAEGGEVQPQPGYGASATNTLDKSKTDAFKTAFNQEQSQGNPKLEQSKVKHYDEGGEVTQDPNPERDLSSMSGLDQIKAVAEYVGNKAKQAYNAVDSTQLGHTLLTGGGDNSSVAPQPPQAAVQNASAVTSEPQKPQFQNVSLGQEPSQASPNQGIPLPNYASQYQQAGNQILGGIKQQAQAEGALGKEQANVYEQQTKDYQAAIQHYQDQQQSINDEIENIKSDVANGHIDPNHYFNSKSTAKQISTTLGLILGGIGGALTHQENPALKFLNANIDRDIEAQRANLGKQNSLLEANLRQYGTLDSAKAATRLNYLAMMDGQLGKLAAQSKDPIAQARYQEMSGRLKMEMAPTMSQLAIQQAGFKMLQNGQQNGQQIAPGKMIALMSQTGVIPKEQTAEAYKEATRITEAHRAGQDAMDAFDKLANLPLKGAFSPNVKDALVDTVATALARNEAGRVNEPERDAYKKIFGKWSDFSPSTINTKRAELRKIVNHKTYSSLLEGFNIPQPQILSGRSIPQGPNFQQSGQQTSMMRPAGMKR